MRRLLLPLLLAAATVAAATGVAASPVSAAPPPNDITDKPFGVPLDELLSHYPDATRLSDGSYELQPGMRLIPPARNGPDAGIAAEPPEYPSDCWDRWFCAWEHADFKGWGIRWYYCDTVTLSFPYEDNISSLHNAQNSLRSYFWNTDRYPVSQGSLGPNSWWRDLSWNPEPGGGYWNDHIDVVDPC